jgi:hypothetical protein
MGSLNLYSSITELYLVTKDNGTATGFLGIIRLKDGFFI